MNTVKIPEITYEQLALQVFKLKADKSAEAEQKAKLLIEACGFNVNDIISKMVKNNK